MAGVIAANEATVMPLALQFIGQREAAHNVARSHLN
jgi:hypothetical protein